MSQGRQRAGSPLANRSIPPKVAGGQVVQDQTVLAPTGRYLRKMTGRQFLLDALLPRQQPIHRLVEIVFRGVGDPQDLGERCDMPPPGGGELAVGLKNPRGHHGDHQVAPPAGAGREQGVEPQPLHRRQDGLHVSVVGGSDGLEQGLHRSELLPPENLADPLDLLDGKRGEIGQGALPDLPPFPIRFAQQVGGLGVPIGDDVDMHGYLSHT